MKLFTLTFLSFFLITLTNNEILIVDGEDANNTNEDTGNTSVSCDDNGSLIIISTMDGILTALDMNSGIKCWTLLLDPEKFLSSTLSELEIYDNGHRVWLVPSLDGSLFKYDNLKIQPLPMDVDTLISHSSYLDAFTSVTGGKVKVIYGIHRLTGEIIYTCKIEGCLKSKIPFPEDILVVEEIISVVNAIDFKKAEKKWHFRVVELKIKLATQASEEHSYAFHNDIDQNALIPSSFKEFLNVDTYKVSLENGFAGMIDKSTQNFLWLFKTSCPICDAWYVKNNVIEVLDPFEEGSGFFSVEMDDRKHTALLFLGTYENQLYIKKSKKFPLKTENLGSLSTSVLYETYSFPVCLKSDHLVIPHDPGSHELIPSSIYVNVSEYGSYFYMNYSIAENMTHCIINTSYIIKYDNKIEISYWFGIYAFALSIIVSLMSVIVIQLLCEKDKKHVNANISSVELAVPKDASNTMQDFKSRFHQDFELLAILGKGGFGVVMDVKNKIDDCRYAVKRIRIHEKLNNSQYEKVLREVKALAKLDHHGIVRYFNAWIEYPPVGWQQIKDMESNIWDVSESSLDLPITSSHLSCKETSLSSKLRERLNLNPLLSFGDTFTINSNEEMSKPYQFSKGSHSTDESIDSSNSSGIIEWQKDAIHSKKLKKLERKSGSSNYFAESSRSTANVFTGDTVDNSEISKDNIYSSFDWYKKNPKIFDFPSAYNNLEVHISEEDMKLLTVIQNLNKSVVYSLNEKMFEEVSKYFFHDAVLASGTNVIENSAWKLFLDFLPKDRLPSLQKWIISILCIIRCSKHSEFDLVMTNLCYILWDVSRNLDDFAAHSYLSRLNSLSETKSSESLTVIWTPDYSSTNQTDELKNFSEDAGDTSKENVSLSEQKSIKNAAPGFLYIQMQLCKKESLRDWLTRHSIYREYNKSIEIFKEIVDAVDYVHNCGLMHRDLKPSNIYFSMEGAIKIGDFGLATSSDIHGDGREENEELSFTHTSDVGTEFYMSPEQKLKQDYDCKTDIYSLGIILFELLVPFKTQSERFQALTKVRKLKFPDEFQQNFQNESELVQMLLNYDPKDRPSTNEIKYHPLLLKHSSLN